MTDVFRPKVSALSRFAKLRRSLGSVRLPLHDPLAIIGLGIYAFFIVMAVFAPLIATHNPNEILFTSEFSIAADLTPGTDGYILGTTTLGRDIFSQIVWGARSALLIGLTAAFMVALIGSIVGIVAGYFGGWVDMVLMRLADVAFGIPFLPFVIVLAAFLEPSIWNVVIAMALVLWRDTGRVIRSQTLTLRNRVYVEAPNVLPLSFLYGSIAIGWAILTEASISFLGFGDPDSISWGYMLQDAFASQALSKGSYYWFVPPGFLIILIVSAGFFITRGYEQILFPKLDR
jgi:peptide/nickel transport system permease protein